MAEASTQPKPFVFVLMPFDKVFDDVYHLGIKAACGEAGAYCERVDEQKFDETVLERIYNQIAKADMLVADMTGRNPNVFYEVGYAHALRKRVILLTQRADDIPFDLKLHQHIVYGTSISKMKAELTKWVRWAIENPKGSTLTPGSTLECFVNGTLVVNNPCVQRGQINPPVGDLLFEIHNSPVRNIEVIDFQIGLFVPSDVRTATFLSHLQEHLAANEFDLGAKGRFLLLEQMHSLLPGGLTKLWVVLGNQHVLPSPERQFVLRFLSGNAPLDFRFRVKG